ncbi:hypothetical protein H0484_08700 [Pusillimonas sp. CC-YST705]|uniref:HTH luxR-type domain-containing protein n=1 Tax=Mesopusillimonas faecipullorum TaxID=2755040 RepID=A0ABS8CCR1_9BURK|nr:helix-turn-helix transcriptional regulator [Mesopusillimonas faecipullorum]MCB5363826.1 hypothetical protein [Mesopusillimonas faecipullorum]
MSIEQLALADLVEAIGSKQFAASAFAVVEQAFQADHIVVQVVEEDRVRGLFTEGRLSARVAATINQRYVERYYMLDESLRALGNVNDKAPTVVHVDPGGQASPTYKNYFFERTGLCDKLSIVSRREAGLLLCNVYRLKDSGPFTRQQLMRAKRLAPVLSAAVWRHLANVGEPALPAMSPSLEVHQAERAALRHLSARESEICRRLLAGASNEGVALDLNVSVHTVRTLRKRIYKKLQVNSLGDLYARYLGAMSAEVNSGR